MKRRYIIATIRPWNIKEARNFIAANPQYKIMLITDRRSLIYDRIKKFNPQYIFFPHWSWIIQEEVFEAFNCVVFHMTDLPFGRGGSPLQNLIIRGISRTKISAIKVVKRLDAGPVYLKSDLSLGGSAHEIFERFSTIVFDKMMPYIMKNEPQPNPQKGKVVTFQRRKPKQSRIPHNIDLEGVNDHIRMLDAEGYPPAFIETQNLHFEFLEALKKGDCVEAKVHIKRKDKRR